MEIDIELLITLVEARPVLWDKTCLEYKDKYETKKAWKEVCTLLENEFEEMNDSEQNDFGKQVIKRWGNVRDAFKKSCKKHRLDAGASTVKKYVYNNQLQFLNKVFKENPIFDSQEPEESESTESCELANEKEKPKKMKHSLDSRKRKNSDQIELQLLKVLEEQSDRHLSFFKGIIPTLNNFTDDEVVEFQFGVMKLITKIKEQKRLVN